MPTASSTAMPPVAESSSSQNGSRASDAIQKGADLLLKLFNEEQSQLTLICRENEKHFNLYKAQAEERIASADYQLAKKTALYENLSTHYVKSVRNLEATENELQRVRAEYAKLMASIGDTGLVYMNGTLHFNDTTAKIVSDFQEIAKIMDMVISKTNPNLNLDPPSLPLDRNSTEALSRTITPSDFFVFLSAVIDKQYAHVLKMQSKSAPFSDSEGNFMSINDATLNLNAGESESSIFIDFPPFVVTLNDLEYFLISRHITDRLQIPKCA